LSFWKASCGAVSAGALPIQRRIPSSTLITTHGQNAGNRYFHHVNQATSVEFWNKIIRWQHRIRTVCAIAKNACRIITAAVSDFFCDIDAQHLLVWSHYAR